MVVPVSNPSKKKRNQNIGAAPAKLEDEGGQGKVSSDYQIEGMLKQAKPAAKLKGTNKDNATINKLGGYDDPTNAPKQTLLQKQKQTADRIRAGGKSKPKATPDLGPAKIEGMIKQARKPIDKPKPKAKPFIEDEGGQGRVSSDYQIEGMIKQARKPTALTAKSKPKAKPKDAPRKSITKALQTNLGRSRTDFGQSDDTGPSKTGPSKRAKTPASQPAKPAETSKAKPVASKPAASPKSATPKLASGPKPKPVNVATRPVKALRTDQELDVNPKRQKAAPEKDDGYKFYGKEGTGLGDFSRKFGFKYATPEQFEKDFGMDDGEQAGGRPGKGKMKTQGLNRSKRSGFSGRGTGAALRGF